MFILPIYTGLRLYFCPKNILLKKKFSHPIYNVKEIMSLDCGIGARNLSSGAILKAVEARKCLVG